MTMILGYLFGALIVALWIYSEILAVRVDPDVQPEESA